MAGVSCHHRARVAAAPRPMTARTALGWARPGAGREAGLGGGGEGGVAVGAARFCTIVAVMTTGSGFHLSRGAGLAVSRLGKRPFGRDPPRRATPSGGDNFIIVQCDWLPGSCSARA